jgi:hypothetical protein
MTHANTVESAFGIKPGDYVRWKNGYWNQYGHVREIYLSFKYPRGLRFWSEPTIKVATVFIIRCKHGTDYHITQDKVKKAERPRHLR